MEMLSLIDYINYIEKYYEIEDRYNKLVKYIVFLNMNISKLGEDILKYFEVDGNDKPVFNGWKLSSKYSRDKYEYDKNYIIRNYINEVTGDNIKINIYEDGNVNLYYSKKGLNNGSIYIKQMKDFIKNNIEINYERI